MKTISTLFGKPRYMAILLLAIILLSTQIECKNLMQNKIKHRSRKYKATHHASNTQQNSNSLKTNEALTAANTTTTTNSTLTQQELIAAELKKAEEVRQQLQQAALKNQTSGSQTNNTNVASTVVQNQTNTTKLAFDPGFSSVTFVKTISDFAKYDLKQQNDPANKNKYLIGRSFYVEDNVTYDETPKLFRDVLNEKVTQVKSIMSDSWKYPEQKFQLWRSRKGNQYQDVLYTGQQQQQQPSYSEYPSTRNEVSKSASNTQSQLEDELSKLENPLKSQSYNSQQSTNYNSDLKLSANADAAPSFIQVKLEVKENGPRKIAQKKVQKRKVNEMRKRKQ